MLLAPLSFAMNISGATPISPFCAEGGAGARRLTDRDLRSVPAFGSATPKFGWWRWRRAPRFGCGSRTVRADVAADHFIHEVCSTWPRVRATTAVHPQPPCRLGFQRADGRREFAERTVVPVQRTPVSVAEAKYLGRASNTQTIGFSRSSLTRQYRAKSA